MQPDWKWDWWSRLLHYGFGIEEEKAYAEIGISRKNKLPAFPVYEKWPKLIRQQTSHGLLPKKLRLA